MQVTVETTGDLTRKMNVVLPAAEFDAKYGDRLRQTAKQARLKGFRPGKVPLREVKRRFGAGILQEVSQELISDSYSNALRQEGIDPAGFPQIDVISAGEGKDFEFAAVFEVYPDIEVQGLDSLSLVRPICDISDADVDRMIDTLREQNKRPQEVERASADGDRVVFDYAIDVGDDKDVNSETGQTVELGAGRTIAALEEGLIGVSAGDEKEIAVEFPDNVPDKAIAGKAGVYRVRVTQVQEMVEPELDDEFFRLFNVQDGDLEAFRTEVKANMTREIEAAITETMEQQIRRELAEANEVTVPNGLVTMKIDQLKANIFGGQVPPTEGNQPSPLDDALRDVAERQVKGDLLYRSIVAGNDLAPEDARVDELIRSFAEAYETPEQVIEYCYNDEARLSEFRSRALAERIVEFVTGTAKVEDKSMSYEEVMEFKRETSASLAPAREDDAQANADSADSVDSADEAGEK